MEEDGLEELSEEDKDEIEGLLEIEEVVVFMEKEGEKIEVKPALVEDDEGNLTTEETPYEALIGEKSSEGITVGITNENSEVEVTDSGQARMTDDENDGVSVKFTQIGTNAVEVRNEDNKALYEGIYSDVDLLLTTLPEGVKEDLILKRPVGYTETGSNVVSPYQGENQWIFEYELELNGLSVEESEKGLKFLDENEKEVMFTPAPVMYDRLGQESYNAYFEIITNDELLITNEEEEKQEEEIETGTGELVLGTGAVVLTETGVDILEELEEMELTEEEIDITDVCVVEEEEELVTEEEIIEEEIIEEETEVQENDDNTFKGVGGDWGSGGGGGGGATDENTETEETEEVETSTGTGEIIIETGTGEVATETGTDVTTSEEEDSSTGSGNVATGTGETVVDEETSTGSTVETDGAEEVETGTGEVVVEETEESEAEAGTGETITNENAEVEESLEEDFSTTSAEADSG